VRSADQFLKLNTSTRTYLTLSYETTLGFKYTKTQAVTREFCLKKCVMMYAQKALA